MVRKIRVAVAGVHGKMGQEAVKALLQSDEFLVVGGLVRAQRQAHQSPENAHQVPEIPLYNKVLTLLNDAQPDVWLDLTDIHSVVTHVDEVLSHGVRPVIGATGYVADDIKRWDMLAKDADIGGIACPNFAVGALLMMRFAAEAAKFLPHAEIIELHHSEKKDAPSGTAKRTRDAMGNSAIPIHSIRLPGLVAHQEVLFGGYGETLTIRHDSMSRQSFMPGILLACKEVMRLNGLVVGLEHLLF